MLDTVSILYHYLKTNMRRFATREQLENWQHKKVMKYMKWLRKHSVFYHEHFGTVPVSEWKKAAPIDKKMMMENFNTLNTVGVNKDRAFALAIRAEKSRNFSPKLGNLTIGLSSGTSGNRGLFIVSDEERVKWAGAMLAKTLPYSLFSNRQQRIAFFLRADSQLYQTVNSQKIQFQFYDLLNDFDQHLVRLQAYQPTILVAPPSMLRLLAQEIEKKTLSINPVKVISVAEVLDPLDETMIKTKFNQIVHQVYQCTEGFLAVTCRYGTLHLNEDLVMIEKEYLDQESGKFIPIITDFSRTSQPIFRYRLNDILTEQKKACPCGSVYTAIKQIEGRCDDMFLFESAESHEQIALFPDFIRNTIISASEEIQEYKVTQCSYHDIDIATILKDETKRKQIEVQIEKALTELFHSKKIRLPSLSFRKTISYIKGKKQKRVERAFREQG